MNNKGQLILGVAILGFGGILLISNLFQINLWQFFWPAALIGLGALILVRQQSSGQSGTNAYFSFAKNLRRSGTWDVSDAEFWHFAGDMRLDFTDAHIPEGECHWRLYGFFHELRLIIPEQVGVAIHANAVVIEDKTDGHKKDRLLTPLRWESPAYASASNKLDIEATGFVVDVRTKITNPDEASEEI